MPSCFFEVSVRTRQKHQSAHCAPLVQIFWPLTSPVIAGVLALGRQRGEVGAGARFRIALAPADLTAADRRDVALLLIFRAVFQQGRAEHAGAHAGHRVRRADLGQFLGQNARVGRIEPAAAVLFRPRRSAPALLGEPLAPELQVGILRLAAHHRVGHGVGLAVQAGRQVRLDPLAGFLAEARHVAAEISHQCFTGSGRPSTRLATTLTLTSDVPPSIELPFERSQPRVACVRPARSRRPPSRDPAFPSLRPSARRAAGPASRRRI